MDIRTAEAQAAQNNPSIISNLSGQNNPAPVAPPAGAPPPQMQETAQNMTNELYGSGYVGGAEQQREQMLQELFAYDQGLEKQYSPFPQQSFYTENPADLSQAYAGMAGATAGNIGATAGTIDTTERAYQMATGAVMDKFMDYLKHQDMMRLEREKMNQASGKSSNIGNIIATLAGGDMMGALSQATSADEVSLILNLSEKLGGGGMTDEQAYYQVMQMPGGIQALANVPADMRAGIAKQMLASGSVGNLPDPNAGILRDIDALEEQYKALTFKGGPFRAFGKAAQKAGELGLNPEAATYEAARHGVMLNFAKNVLGLAAQNLGTEQVRAMLDEMVPGMETRPVEAEQIFQRLRTDIANRSPLNSGVVDEGGNVDINRAPSFNIQKPPLEQFWNSPLQTTGGY